MAHGKKDEVNAIWREIHQVDGIQNSQERRLTLLRRLNSVQASTASLPSETLSLIFHFECAPLQDYRYICPSDPAHAFPCSRKIYSALTLSHVSSHWREVAWSTPQLWNKMGIEVNEKNADGILSLLKLYLQNSKALPFDLNLKFSRGGADCFNKIEPMFFDRGYCNTIRALRLVNSHLKWLLNISTRCPQLECLSIDGTRVTSSDRLSLEPAPLLRHVHLEGVAVEVLSPCSSITHLELVTVPIDSCVKLLTQCPNLLYFQSKLPRRPSAESTPPIHITTLHHLQTLRWEYSDTSWCEAILQCIRLLSLRKLTWAERPSMTDAQPCIHALLPRLPNTLLNLELFFMERWRLPLFRFAFSHTCHIQDLTLRSCSRECLYALFCALCPGWEGDTTQYLPFLKSLSINECSDSDSLGTSFSRRFLEICRAKHVGPDSRFKLVLKEVRMYWARGIRKELREMVRDGFRLEIMEHIPT